MSDEQYNKLLKAYTKEALANMIKADIRQRFPAPYACMCCQQFDNKKCWGFLCVCSKFNEEMKQNHKQWAEMVLQGFKQRLHECGKIG